MLIYTNEKTMAKTAVGCINLHQFKLKTKKGSHFDF